MSNCIQTSPRASTPNDIDRSEGDASPKTPNDFVFMGGQFRSIINSSLYDPGTDGRFLSPSQADGIEALSSLRASPPPTNLQSLAPVITSAQLQELISQLTSTIKQNNENPPANKEHLFSIAKSEYYISQGLTYKFDGDHENLPLGSRNSKHYGPMLYGVMRHSLPLAIFIMTF